MPATGEADVSRQNLSARCFWSPIGTAAGPCGVAWCYHPRAGKAGWPRLVRLWPAHRNHLALARAVRREFPTAARGGAASGTNRPRWLEAVRRFLKNYYHHPGATRKPPHPPPPGQWQTWLDWTRCTEFQRRVLSVTASITPGKTLTYGQVARLVGAPRAARAVGAALARNPWPVLIGCHRVIGAAGEMRGFSAPGGMTAKQQMLARERQPPRAG